LRKMEATGPGHHVSLAPRRINDRSLDGKSRAADGPGGAAGVASRRR
jgi:hypothetical protein